jgi:hypothetical protein
MSRTTSTGAARWSAPSHRLNVSNAVAPGSHVGGARSAPDERADSAKASNRRKVMKYPSSAEEDALGSIGGPEATAAQRFEQDAG